MRVAKRKFTFSRAIQARLPVFRCAFVAFILSFFFVASSLCAPRDEGSLAVPPSLRDASVRPGLSFAFADFDGDSHPDLVDVQFRKRVAANSLYWIDLRLSTAGREFIPIIAPAGGLRIDALDVNGDALVDLVLFTEWTNQPVAVYLNDGHGGFRGVAPSSFPQVFQLPGRHWVCLTQFPSGSVGILPEWRLAVDSECACLFGVSARGRPAECTSRDFFPSPTLVSFRDRAPPFGFFGL